MILAARTLSAKSYSITCARGFFTWRSPIHEFLVSFTAIFSAFIGKGVIQWASNKYHREYGQPAFIEVEASICIWTLLITMILAARTLSAKSYSITCARGFFTWRSPIHEFLVSFTAIFSAFIGKGVIQWASLHWKWWRGDLLTAFLQPAYLLIASLQLV